MCGSDDYLWMAEDNLALHNKTILWRLHYNCADNKLRWQIHEDGDGLVTVDPELVGSEHRLAVYEEVLTRYGAAIFSLGVI